MRPSPWRIVKFKYHESSLDNGIWQLHLLSIFPFSQKPTLFFLTSLVCLYKYLSLKPPTLDSRIQFTFQNGNGSNRNLRITVPKPSCPSHVDTFISDIFEPFSISYSIRLACLQKSNLDSPFCLLRRRAKWRVILTSYCFQLKQTIIHIRDQVTIFKIIKRTAIFIKLIIASRMHFATHTSCNFIPSCRIRISIFNNVTNLTQSNACSLD